MWPSFTDSNRVRDLGTDLASSFTALGVVHSGLFGPRHLDLQHSDSQGAVNATHISSSASSSSFSLTMFVLAQLLLVWDTLEDDLLDLTLCFSGV